MSHFNCKSSEAEIAKALVSNKRTDYHFCLKREVGLFNFFSNELTVIDKMKSIQINDFINSRPDVVDDFPSEKKHERVNKKAIKSIDLNIASYQYFGGVDLMEIPEVSFSLY